MGYRVRPSLQPHAARAGNKSLGPIYLFSLVVSVAPSPYGFPHFCSGLVTFVITLWPPCAGSLSGAVAGTTSTVLPAGHHLCWTGARFDLVAPGAFCAGTGSTAFGLAFCWRSVERLYCRVTAPMEQRWRTATRKTVNGPRDFFLAVCRGLYCNYRCLQERHKAGPKLSKPCARTNAPGSGQVKVRRSAQGDEPLWSLRGPPGAARNLGSAPRPRKVLSGTSRTRRQLIYPRPLEKSVSRDSP